MEIRLKNLGTINKNKVDIGNLEIYFSYETPVAFNSYDGKGAVCSENIWSTTTGKLLHEVCPDKKTRVPNEKFRDQLEKAINKVHSTKGAWE
jgi:hypothetical protein